MSATIAGHRIVSAQIRMPEIGNWHVNLEASGGEALSGAQTVEIEGQTFQGFVVPGRAGVSGGRTRAKLMGGAGGMTTVLPARDYSDGPSVRAVVTDLLREAGETLSTTAEDAVLSQFLKHYERIEATAGRALTTLLERVGAIWRVLADGTVWIGLRAFPAQTFDHTVIDEDWTRGVLEIASAAPELRPGVTFDTYEIRYVVHRIESGGLRTLAYLSGSPGNVFERVFAGLRRAIDYSRKYPARVVSQRADGRLQLLPDDESIRGVGGLDQVSIRYGTPGYKATVPKGTRCQLGFEAGDPSKPYADGFSPGDVTDIVFDESDRPVARVGDEVQVFLPPQLPIAGTIAPSTPFVGVLTVTSPMTGLVTTGNPKHKT